MVRKRRRFRRRGNAALALAKANRRILNRREVKKHDKNVGWLDITATSGSVEYLSDIDTGDTSTTREGDEIQSRWLHVKYAIRDGGSGEHDIILVKIFRKDVQINQVPTMYNTSTSDVLEAGTPLSSLDMRNSEKYTILYSEKFILNASGQEAFVRDVYLDLKGRKNHYLASGNGTADAGNGSYWIGFYTDQTGGTDKQPEYCLNSRYAFSDL